MGCIFPFSAVQKGDVDLTKDARLIHDLAFLKGASVNDNTVDVEEITVSYDGVAPIAKRILNVVSEHPGQQNMMTGDVNGVFRLIPVAADAVR
ncbi:hypothetical protein F443_13250 [Phytophthora nicotianae P1569]|uniref:Uncharacterized protein n=1 Tax=Phytophthora nicotianae P1569 TaxID=1317065 RepID=V9ETY0_PHYNI|nr:hypothetical protein F443_13250 [Phytophthora nicotianae P1569]